MPVGLREDLSKVPAATLGFWVVKIAATTLGETAGDAVSMVDQLDLSNLTRQYTGRGSKAHHPANLRAFLV